MGCGSSTALREVHGSQDAKTPSANIQRAPEKSSATSDGAGQAHPLPLAAGRQGLVGEEPTKLRCWSHRTHQWDDDEVHSLLLGSFPKGHSTRSSEFAEAIAALSAMPEGASAQVRHRTASSSESETMAWAAASVLRIQRAARRFLRARKTSQEAAQAQRLQPPPTGAGEAGPPGAAHGQTSGASTEPRPNNTLEEPGQLSRAPTDKAIDPSGIDTKVNAVLGKAMAGLEIAVGAPAEEEADLDVACGSDREWPGIVYFRREAELRGPMGDPRSPVKLTDSMRRWSGVAYYHIGAEG
uniref:Uncharacterized protein n=1 Tax=Hemiselmis tepida TaxID=464990 RepID=A0A7S0W3A3_9CRYP|mmetsp:Transcript_30065/g.76189  ORF Transcript_30065/g.76189 Transcript_30065/m.76189 type:complete len:297 (+) Transcript_30065:164-1054(+)|eukprot:CAMPEP_0174924150 /NCGR_PEP_ID=MMETSP1355-20121228/7056_1 /TAXON_ID=464990 /ORGANISM="Hemiselmis tepida, Strain CCMP443" /LENGTH=296 /DNA_ID=CAMNT_0016169921 /DNA_START=140 /DNA_END=1030 /DNA_ORIENTATION=-